MSPTRSAVILGATSLDEAVAGIEGLSRATAQNRRLSVEATARARRLARLSAHDSPSSARAWTRAAERRARGRRAPRSGRRGHGDATVAAVRRARSLTTQRLAALEARAQAAEQPLGRASRCDARPRSTRAPPRQPVGETTEAPGADAAAPPPRRRRARGTLVVDAVAYHLPGKTASGLPVGVGVIAVDPTVIPLGTRVFVPGYGPAVAADVGSAIKGNIIDLWMPSTAQARAWGRRTVTITIYG